MENGEPERMEKERGWREKESEREWIRRREGGGRKREWERGRENGEWRGGGEIQKEREGWREREGERERGGEREGGGGRKRERMGTRWIDRTKNKADSIMWWKPRPQRLNAYKLPLRSHTSVYPLLQPNTKHNQTKKSDTSLVRHGCLLGVVLLYLHVSEMENSRYHPLDT